MELTTATASGCKKGRDFRLSLTESFSGMPPIGFTGFPNGAFLSFLDPLLIRS